MKVYIDQPRGKENLVKAFEEAGAEVVRNLTPDVKLIIPTVDETLPTWAKTKDFFEKQGIRVMVSSWDAIFETRDKAEFARFCRRHSFSTPITMQGHMVLKPRFGKGSKGVQHIDRSYIVQEKMVGEEVSIDYFADFDGNPVSIIPRYRLGVVNGAATESKVVENFEFKEVKRLGEDLRLIGHNVIQGFLVEGRMCFTDVNCRFGGGSYLTFPIFNSPEWLIKNA